MNYLDGLNERQKEAVTFGEGPLMILAGAGAGKTKTLTHRIAHLVAGGVPADAILAVTFTNKAANEMRERVDRLLVDSRVPIHAPLIPHADVHAPKRRGIARGRLPYVATFHSLCVHILREQAALLSIPRSFTIWDRADSIHAIKQALKETGMEKQYEPKSILGRISREKGNAVGREEFASGVGNVWEEAVAEAWEAYERALTKEHALDFDDLLLRALVLLTEHEDVRVHYRARWGYLLVDEYQDTNQVQFEIARLLAEPAHNICVVGDVDQCIYTWRQARIENLLSFETHFPGVRIILLEENYRSTQIILAAANDIISKNTKRYEKNLFTKNGEGEPLFLYSAASEEDEARFVAEEAAREIARGTRAREIAVLYRANFQSRTLEEAFLSLGVPYRVLGTRFFERKEVKDALSYIRAALNPKSRVDLSRIVASPPRGIGKVTLMRMLDGTEEMLAANQRTKAEQFRVMLTILRKKARAQKPSETVKYVIRASGLEVHLMKSGEEGAERLENLKELVTLATKYDDLPPQEGIEKMLEEAALLGEQDSLDASLMGGAEAVSLMTVHASKGLEFDVIFITGLEEGLFPHERNDEDVDEEEERRLFYVALTRARKKVFLSHAMSRMMYGERSLTVPSQFLVDIDPVRIKVSDAAHTNDEPLGLIDF